MATGGPTGGPRSRGGAPPPSWAGCCPLVKFLLSVFVIYFGKHLTWSFRTFGAVQNRSLICAPFPVQNSSCRHSPSSSKPYKLRENRHEYFDVITTHNALNINIKAWCKMYVSTPPSLDLACSQAKADIDKYVHMFRDRGVDKIKYGHEGIMIIFRTTTYNDI